MLEIILNLGGQLVNIRHILHITSNGRGSTVWFANSKEFITTNWDTGDIDDLIKKKQQEAK
jgi:hypothetical protein